jgi:tetratricopeptide (TPR) repeat protein
MPRTLSGVLLLACCSFTTAQQPDKAALASKASAILKANCYRCHGQDGAVEGGLNYVLDLKKLVARKKVLPGKPEQSRLFRRLTSEDNPMPPAEEKIRPTKEDIAALGSWITAGAPDLADDSRKRQLIAPTAVLESIGNDLSQMQESRRRFARYITLTHLYNQGLTAGELETYRHGISKLVNSLSWQPEIAVPRAIDAAGTIFRIDLRDYRWNAAAWQRLIDLYPYGVFDTAGLSRSIARATECEMPVVRGDWFVFAASRPPLYHDILELPRTALELEQDLKIDVEADIRDERAARAGFNSSGVSRNNRLIERHASAFGAYWKSYDFAGNADRRNLFAHPLGPGRDSKAFEHDGGEIIFNLPNGLQAYLLVDGKGNRIDEGPTKIVSIKNRPDPAVTNGVSCMFCHARGMIEKTDQIRSHVEKNPAGFTDDEIGSARALYPPSSTFTELVHKDRDRFLKAVLATGAKAGATEPVAALAERFEAELDLLAAAAELGVSSATLQENLDKHPDLAQRLGTLRIPGGTVQRQVFVEQFPDVIEAFELGASQVAVRKTLADTAAAIRSHPEDPLPYFRRGNAFLARGDVDRALGDYTESVRAGFRGSEVFEKRGQLFAEQGDFDRAIEDYDQAVRLNPKPATHHNRGLARARKGNLDGAIADFTEAIRLEPNRAPAYSDRGLAHYKQGIIDKAIDDFTRAIELSPNLASAYLRRGDAYRKERDQRAAADYAKYVELNPNSPRAVELRGELPRKERK